MPVFDRQIATALRLIDKYGQTVDWTKAVESLPDPDKPWEPVQDSELIFNPKICFIPLNLEDLKTFGYAAGSSIPKGAVKGLMGAVVFEPILKDWVIRNGKRLNIDKFNVLSPNGEIILYTIIFKD